MKNKTHFIFDTETNGLGNCSVLSISFIIYRKNKILDKQTRYYFPQEDYNYHAIKINGLEEKVISKHRENINYPLYFKDDDKWIINLVNEFNVENIVAHNISFDIKYLPSKIKAKIDNKQYSTFCTMRKNANIMPKNKAPKLSEACKIYGIYFNNSYAHSSEYDTLKAYEVFLKTMIRRDWRS
jgi:DNA polymerase III alpha subunit (gram-positive type)